MTSPCEKYTDLFSAPAFGTSPFRPRPSWPVNEPPNANDARNTCRRGPVIPAQPDWKSGCGVMHSKGGAPGGGRQSCRCIIFLKQTDQRVLMQVGYGAIEKGRVNPHISPAFVVRAARRRAQWGFRPEGRGARTRLYVEHPEARKHLWVRCIAGRSRKLVRYAGLNQAAAASDGNRLQPAVDLEPGEDVLDMVARRRYADAELTGNGSGTEPLPHQPQHFDLSPGELYRAHISGGRRFVASLVMITELRIPAGTASVLGAFQPPTIQYVDEIHLGRRAVGNHHYRYTDQDNSSRLVAVPYLEACYRFTSLRHPHQRTALTAVFVPKDVPTRQYLVAGATENIATLVAKQPLRSLIPCDDAFLRPGRKSGIPHARHDLSGDHGQPTLSGPMVQIVQLHVKPSPSIRSVVPFRSDGRCFPAEFLNDLVSTYERWCPESRNATTKLHCGCISQY